MGSAGYSVLRPTLFLLHINDVADIFTDLTVPLSLFADDLKLYSDYTVDATHSDIQAAINRLTEWTKKWQLQISIPKCSAFRINNTQWNLVNEVADLTYNTDGHVLPFTDHIRDLGVHHDSRHVYVYSVDTTNIFQILSIMLFLDQC